MKNEYRKFFVRLFILVVIFFVIDFAIGKTLKHFYFKQSSGYQYRLTYVIDRAKEEALVFGSSRANHHYVPAVFQDSLKLPFYNAGVDGQFILFEGALVRCVLSRYSPKYVVLDFNADEFVYSERSYDMLADLLPYYPEHYNELNSIIDLKSKYEKVKLLSKMYPFNSVVLTIMMGNLESNKKRKEDDRGYVPLTGRIDYNVKPSVIKEGNIDSNKINAFKDLISRCKNSGVKVFVVVSPYFEAVEQSSINLGSQIANEMNVPFWDYSNDTSFIRRKELFKDVIHLNDSGAIIFSQKVVQRINESENK